MKSQNVLSLVRIAKIYPMHPDLNLRWAHMSEGTFSDVVAKNLL